MEDVKFTRSHSNSPLPEAGNEPDDPLRPEIDEENSTPNPPIGHPTQDEEVTEDKAEMPDQEDIEEAGLSDNESALSDLDDQQFEDFDVGEINIEERPAQLIDDTNIGLIGVHKRKRTEGEGDAPKKKHKRVDRPRRKKNRDGDTDGIEESGGRKSKRSRKEGRVRGASPDDEMPEENLTPAERKVTSCDYSWFDANCMDRSTTRSR
jgi:transcription factor SPN1